jgi:heat shock protein beta
LFQSSKHSSFSTAFPIYLWTEKTVEVPDEEAEEAASKLKESVTPEAVQTPVETAAADDEEAAIVEDEATSSAEDATEETKPQPMKSVQVAEWIQANPQAPLWQRDPKDVTEEEYVEFYKSTFKDYADPLAWHHFAGDSGTGTSFRAIIYIPSRLSVNLSCDPDCAPNCSQRPCLLAGPDCDQQRLPSHGQARVYHLRSR